MTDVERRERRERIATAVLAAMYSRNDPQINRATRQMVAQMAIDAADALVEELDRVDE